MTLSSRLATRDTAAGSPLAAARRRVHAELLEQLGPRLAGGVSEDDLRERVADVTRAVLERDGPPLTAADRAQVAVFVLDEILGHGPLEPFLRDPGVSEIMVNGPGRVWVERSGMLEPAGVRFDDEDHLRRVIDKIVARVGRRVDESSPMADARLPDGSRVNAVVPPVALDGSLLTIRKFAADPLTAADLLKTGTITVPLLRLLRAAVQARLNIVISGGTGSGKTTTLNVLSGYAGHGERIITIEDAAELQLHQEHVLRLESRPPNMEDRGEVTIRHLVRNALRMRPDRIIVGEVRDGAAMDMLQAMNTGHDGSMTTLHANSPADAIRRLETLAKMSGIAMSELAVREQIASAVQLILHQARLSDGTRKVVSVAAMAAMSGGAVTLDEVLTLSRGTLRPTGRGHGLRDLLAARGQQANEEDW